MEMMEMIGDETDMMSHDCWGHCITKCKPCMPYGMPMDMEENTPDCDKMCMMGPWACAKKCNMDKSMCMACKSKCEMKK